MFHIHMIRRISTGEITKRGKTPVEMSRLVRVKLKKVKKQKKKNREPYGKKKKKKKNTRRNAVNRTGEIGKSEKTPVGMP